MPAPIGNNHSQRGRVWRDAISRALAKRSKVDAMEAIDDLADKLIGLGMDGDMSALKEIGDRLDGKAAQSVEISGNEDAPIITRIVIESVASPKRE